MVFGKLGDVYGYKPVILLSYIGFAVGWLAVGTNCRLEKSG
jgi:MFS family permease